MNYKVIIIVLTTVLGIVVISVNKRISSKLTIKPNDWMGYDDISDILIFSGCWMVSFSLLLGYYYFRHFNPSYFIVIGSAIGIISSVISFTHWFKLAEKDSNDKYSGGGIGSIGVGCLGLIIIPLLGTLIGWIIKVIL
ncbi:MAG TPA: hypothetical protein VIH57_14890 [Bacteroidales bacterium]